jgi:hypothetical protein
MSYSHPTSPEDGLRRIHAPPVPAVILAASPLDRFRAGLGVLRGSTAARSSTSGIRPLRITRGSGAPRGRWCGTPHPWRVCPPPVCEAGRDTPEHLARVSPRPSDVGARALAALHRGGDPVGRIAAPVAPSVPSGKRPGETGWMGVKDQNRTYVNRNAELFFRFSGMRRMVQDPSIYPAPRRPLPHSAFRLAPRRGYQCQSCNLCRRDSQECERSSG